MQRDLMEKVDNMQEQMDNISREMATLRKLKRGAAGWLSQLSVCLRLRS